MSIQRKTVAAPAAYPVDPNLTFDFDPKQIVLQLEEVGVGKSATFSFDGVNDHVYLEYNTTFNRSYTSLQRVRKVWVKGTNTALVSATAEA